MVGIGDGGMASVGVGLRVFSTGCGTGVSSIVRSEVGGNV